MAHFKPSEEQLERRASVGRWQIVRASFGTANEDLIIRHQLQTPDPEQVAYQALNMTGPSNLYHDGSATRLAWGDGFVRLRSSVAPVIMDILLQVVAAPIGTTKLPMGGATIPGINADTLDGLDSTAFTRNAFKTFVIDGAGDIVADEPEDTFTFTAGTGIAFNSIPGDDEVEIEALAPVIDELDDILDVNAGTPADGDVLTWDNTAGEWVAAAPTGGGGGGGGNVVQTVNYQTGAVATGGTIIPLDDTIPQSTEGDQYMTLAITPTDATNKLKIEVHLFCVSNAANWITTALFQDSAASAISAWTNYQNIGSGGIHAHFSHWMTAGTTSSTTFKIRAGRDASAGSLITINGAASSRFFGGIVPSSITITEIDPTPSGGGGGASELDDLTDVDVPAPTDGDVLTWDSGAGEWVAAAPAATGSSGALVFLEEHIASSSATLDFTTWYDTDYDDYQIEIIGLIPATDGAIPQMLFSTNGGSSYEVTNYRYSTTYKGTGGTSGVTASASATSIAFVPDGVESTASSSVLSGQLHLFNPGSTTRIKVVNILISYQFTNLTYYHRDGLGVWAGLSAVNAIRFQYSTGNIAEGVVRIYGIAKTAGGGGGGGASELDDLTDVDAPSPADGDVLTWDSATSEWVAAAPTGGGGGGALVFLEEHTASASATLNFTSCITSTYDEYQIEFVGIRPATDAVTLEMRMSTDGGSSYDSGANYGWSVWSWRAGAAIQTGTDTGATALRIGSNTISNSVSARVLNGTVKLYNPGSSSLYKEVNGNVSYYVSTATYNGFVLRGAYLSTTAVNAFQFYCSSGNIASGSIRVYGVAKTASGGGGGASELDDLTDVDAPTPADGDVLTWDSATGEWVATAPTGGGGGSGGWTLVEEHIATASSELLFTDWYSSDYDEYQIRISNYLPGTNATTFAMTFSTNGGASYDTAANYSWASFAYVSFATGLGGANGTTSITIFPSVEIDAGWIGAAQLEFTNPGSAKYKALLGSLNYRHTDRSGVDVMGVHWTASYNSVTPVNAIRFYVSSGTFSGTVRVYGITKEAAGETSSPGAVVQVQNYQTGAHASGTTLIPHDDTIPQSTEGTQFLTLAITPTNAANLLQINVLLYIGNSAASRWVLAALFQDATANALAATMKWQANTNEINGLSLSYSMLAGTTSPTTFKVHGGAHDTGTTNINGTGSRTLGGVQISSIRITEIDPAGTGASGILSDAVGQLDIANTTTETTLYTYSVPAGALGTSKGFAVNLIGDWLNDTGANQTLRLRIKYGATTLHDESTGTMPTATVRRPWNLNIQFGNTGTTSSQFATVSWLLGNATAGTAGFGDASVAMHLNHLGSGTSAEDSTLVKALTVTMELSAASTSLSFRRQNGSLKEL